jgi:hypothetical protein
MSSSRIYRRDCLKIALLTVAGSKLLPKPLWAGYVCMAVNSAANTVVRKHRMDHTQAIRFLRPALGLKTSADSTMNAHVEETRKFLIETQTEVAGVIEELRQDLADSLEAELKSLSTACISKFKFLLDPHIPGEIH